MNKATTQSLAASLIAVIVGVLMAWACGQGGVQVTEGLSLFMACTLFAFGTQWLVFIPSYIGQTEHYFDLTGSITYLTITLTAVSLTDNPGTRSLVISALVLIWAFRLGTFLFVRVRKAGKDRRFDQMKTRPAQFLMTWTLQGLWVVMTAAAALTAITSPLQTGMDVFAWVGLGVWLLGFGIEVIADKQKSEFRKENTDDFITTGLWAWSRHPNYFGEIVLWCGVAIMAIPTFEGWRFVALLSPLFVLFLLTRVSGVRMLEVQAEKRWGGDPVYQDYVNRTPVLVPLPPG